MKKWEAIIRRWMKFNVVGATGVAVQMFTLFLLARVAGLHYLVATVLAVEASVINNFIWHRKWTWADRVSEGALRLLVRFHLTSGILSLTGNLLLMWLLAGAAGLNPILANMITITACSLVNFTLSDRIVFI